jgi:hypothetical protein
MSDARVLQHDGFSSCLPGNNGCAPRAALGDGRVTWTGQLRLVSTKPAAAQIDTHVAKAKD